MIAAILENPAPHAGKIYPLYGPIEMNHTEIAAELTRALGQQVTYTPIELDEFTDILLDAGFGDHTIQHLRSVAIDYRNGVFAGTNDPIETVGKKKPFTVGEFDSRNKKFFFDRGSWGYA